MVYSFLLLLKLKQFMLILLDLKFKLEQGQAGYVRVAHGIKTININ